MSQSRSLSIDKKDLEILFISDKEKLVKLILEIKDKYELSYKEISLEIVNYLYQNVYLFR